MAALSYEVKDTILHVSDLGVSYGGKQIIEKVSFIEQDCTRPGRVQGQTIAFLGRSGRGKSTLFRALTGLETPSEGHVLIPDFSKPAEAGRQPARPVCEGDVGFVDQAYTLFRHKTVYQALHFALRAAKLTEAQKRETILEHLRDWGLEKQQDQYPNQLSGGQRQRTAILEQLLNSGLYMVLDEPFSGLDVGNIENVREAFALIAARNELNTILFSTHDIELAVSLADSIYVLGYPTLAGGSLHPVGTILQHFDLKALGLAWHEGALTPAHLDCVNDIRQILLRS